MITGGSIYAALYWVNEQPAIKCRLRHRPHARQLRGGGEIWIDGRGGVGQFTRAARRTTALLRQHAAQKGGKKYEARESSEDAERLHARQGNAAT